MAWKLAELFVELSARGFNAVAGQVDQLKEKLSIVAGSADAMAAKFEAFAGRAGAAVGRVLGTVVGFTKQTLAGMGFAGAAWESFGKTISAIGDKAKWVFAGMTAAVGLWVRAGLQGTTVGNALSTQMGLLSREVASLFLPQILALIRGIQELTLWFRNLTGGQQKMVAGIIAGTIAGAAMLALIPLLVSGITTVAAAFIGLAEAESVATAGIAPLIGLIVGVLVGGVTAGAVALTTFGSFMLRTGEAIKKFWAALQPVRDALQRIWDKLLPVREALVGLAATFAEINLEILVASLVTLAEVLERIIDTLDKMAQAAEKAYNAIAKIPGLGGVTNPFQAFENFRAKGRAALAGAEGTHQTVGAGHVGFETGSDTYKRIAEAGLRVEIPQQQLAEAKKANDYLKSIDANTSKGGSLINPWGLFTK